MLPDPPLAPFTRERGPAASRRAALGEDERRVLLAVLDIRSGRRIAWPRTLEWHALVQAARDGKIAALLAHRVATEGAVVPDAELGAALRDALHESAVYNTRLLAELARAVSVLDHAGVASVALKGAVLMARHYPTPAVREAVDLDLLIDPARFEIGLGALRAAGFRDADYTAQTAFDGQTFADALNAPHWHACAPLSGETGVQLDLHRRMPTTGYAARGGFAGLHTRAESISVHGVDVRMCPPLELAVHLCEHFALQNHAHPEGAPRLLCDLRVLFAGEPPWVQLQQGPLGQRLAVAVARRLYAAAFAPDGESERLTRLLQRVAVADPGVTPLLAELSQLHGYARRFAVDVVRRPGYALRKLLPSRSHMAERYGVDPRSARLYPLYGKRLWDALTAPLRK